MSKKRHKKSRHRTPSPDRVDEKSAEKQRRVASEKKREGTREHHGSVSFQDRKRKPEYREKNVPSPKTTSSGSIRELKKPVYRLSTSAEKKDSRKREQEISSGAGQHRRHEHRQGEKKHRETCHAATAVSTKDRKSASSSSETRRSHLHSTSSPQRSKANHSQDQHTVSGGRASHSTASRPTECASIDLQEQRRKLVKRRSEGENAEPPAKTSRSTPAPLRWSEELREERKKLVERRRSTEEVKLKTSSAKQEKAVQQDKTRRSSTATSSSSSSSAKLSRPARLNSGSTSQPAPGTPTSSAANHASPKPQSSVSFRISKKPSAPPPREYIWDQGDGSTDQSAASPPKFPSKQKAAQTTSSFIPRSITKAGKATAAPKSHSAAKASQFSASFKPLSSAEAGQTGASYEPLSTTKAVQASVSVTASFSKSHCSTVAGQVTVSPEPPYTPRAGPSTVSLSSFSTAKAIQNASSFGTVSTTEVDETAASPELFSTPRTAHQAYNLTSPICWPQQQEKENKGPQGFHSGAAVFNAPVHPPVKTQVMPESVLENQPSFWSSQAVPASSFIFSEDNHDLGDSDQEMQLLEELQQARCEHLLEVNLVESYGELTAMDIDPPDEGATPTSMLSKEVMQQDLLIVLDTNILLSHLDLVKKIRSHGLGSLGFPTVLIPWVVLQELDAMKNGKLTSAVERRATPAVNYIYSCLKSQEPRLWGQSMQQASLALCGLKTENNDDRVLQCCLQYQKLYPKSGLILCTNDKNLCSKAVLSGVRALSKADLLQEVDRLKAGVLSTAPVADQRTACPSWQPANKDEGRKSREESSPKVEGTQKDKEEEPRSAAPTSRDVSESVCVLDDTLKTVLSAILEHEMTEVYGDLWNEIVYLKPPWSLGQVLQCVKKHWIAVFGNIVQRGLQSYISQLSDYLCTNKTVDHKRVLKALSLAVELLTGFSSRSDYRGLLPQSLSTLQGLLQRLQPQPSRSPKADEDSAMLEEEPSEERGVTHQEVWQVFENTWTNVWGHSTAVFTAFRYVPGSMETAPPPSQDALCCLHKLCVAVPQLQQLFQRLLSADCSVNDAQSLLNFIQTTEIAAVEPRFTAQALYDCLSQQEYRQKLYVGSTQLSDVQVNLERCAAAVERMWS